MKSAAVCVLLVALAGPLLAAPGDAPPRTKPSSFTPHAVPPNRAYGAPIQSQILHKRNKRKPAGASNTPS